MTINVLWEVIMYKVNSICSVIGMRSYTFPTQMQERQIRGMIHRLELELERAVSEGKIIFQSGMSMGADIWAAKAVLRLRESFPQIQLHCYLPCETQANHWPEQWREPYFEVLGEADEVYCMQQHYSKGSTARCSWEMLSRSSKAIILCGKKADGGITQAIDFCRNNNIEKKVIRQSGSGKLETINHGPVISLPDYIRPQTSSVYLAGFEMGISAIKRA